MLGSETPCSGSFGTEREAAVASPESLKLEPSVTVIVALPSEVVWYDLLSARANCVRVTCASSGSSGLIGVGSVGSLILANVSLKLMELSR